MQKAHYALAFMALCGVVLVVHELQGPEVLKQSEDPFLAAVEKATSLFFYQKQCWRVSQLHCKTGLYQTL